MDLKHLGRLCVLCLPVGLSFALPVGRGIDLSNRRGIITYHYVRDDRERSLPRSAVLPYYGREDQPSNPAEEALLRPWWHLNYKRGKYGEAGPMPWKCKPCHIGGGGGGVNREVTIHNLARLSLELNDLLRLSSL